jgi:ketosteroid isomerase-like protein
MTGADMNTFKNWMQSGYRRLAAGISALALVGAVALVFSAPHLIAQSSPAVSASPVQWDAAAGKDLEQALMKMHDAWNTFDMKAMDRMIAGDDRLVTFDLDPDTAQPITLHNKAEIMKFTQTIFAGFQKQGIKSIAEHPMIACKVSGNLGFCTEECKIKLVMADGKTDTQRLRGTAIAERTSEGWKWLEWHMSPALPNGVTASAAHDPSGTHGN